MYTIRIICIQFNTVKGAVLNRDENMMESLHGATKHLILHGERSRHMYAQRAERSASITVTGW